MLTMHMYIVNIKLVVYVCIEWGTYKVSHTVVTLIVRPPMVP